MRTKFQSKPFILALIFILAIPRPLFAQKPTRLPAPRPSSHLTQISDNVIADLLAMQPLAPEEEETTQTANEAEAKPPADTAPIKELIEYWSNRNDKRSDDAKPSDVVQQRLLEAGLNRPESLIGLLHALPDSPATNDQLYKLFQENADNDDAWKSYVRTYLFYKSLYFREALIDSAQGKVESELGNPIEALEVLAKLDWEAAKPIVEQKILAAASVDAPEALRIQREHALRIGHTTLADSALAQLKDIVVNRQANFISRRLALAGAIKDEWSGQEEWFLSLFADPTLTGIASEKNIAQAMAERETMLSPQLSEALSGAAAASKVLSEAPMNLLADTAAQNATKWIPLVTPLVGDKNVVIHNAAVNFLAEIKKHRFDRKDSKELIARRKEAALMLLPWLTNSHWALVSGREDFINSLSDLELPEAVPGLLTILDSESDSDVANAAVKVLLKYKDARAVGSLKRLLQKEMNEEARNLIITAIVMCGGFSDEEMAAAIEAYTWKMSSEEIARALMGQTPLPLNVSIGRVLYESQDIPATEGLALRLFARAKELQFNEPVIAQKILSGIERVPLTVAYLNLLDRISTDNVDVEPISYALENRRDWQKSVGEAIYPLLAQGGSAAGIAAILLGELGRQADILAGKDAKAQLALLAAARHVRAKLPVTAIAPLLNNPLLAKAAESYLEIENSAAARSLIWARHPKQAWIVGESIVAENGSDAFHQQLEKKLQREVLSQNGKLEIYAILAKFYGAEGEENGNLIVRVRGENAEISLPNSNGYRKYRALTPNEVQDLKKLTATPEIEDLGPESFPTEDDASDGSSHEYLRLNQESGRRILLRGVRRAPKKDATEYEQLAGLFHTLSRTGDFKVRYDLEDKIRGLEVLFTNEKQKVLSIGQAGTELRVLVSKDLTTLLRKRDNDPFPYEWRSFADGQLGGLVSPPTALADFFAISKTLLTTRPQMEGHNGLGINLLPDRRIVYWAIPYGSAPGIWKLPVGGDPVKVREGAYLGLAVTADEKWAITNRIPPEERDAPTMLRINLQTGEERPINLPAGIPLWAQAFIPSQKQVLLTRSAQREYVATMKSFLLDLETGKVQLAKGEFRPLLEKSWQLFQPTGNLNEVWAAIYDQDKETTSVGRYHLTQFTFTSIWELPDLRTSQLEIWIQAGHLYFAHDGNLLRVPVPKP